ncbi:Hsp70 family protein [Micromonospora sicca]|uniref:Hsp70 family protein n=1 Tax=Micromonospora sicca TaxID=2202420 RepID=UPI001F388536|nr:Hsp70 family protein [Micromonospora sp. 4G51]
MAWPDGTWIPLMFDGEPALPSAVFLCDDGNLLTGQRAWQAAVAQPERFIPAPRRSVEQQMTVAGTDVEALGLVAATLRRVAAEAWRTVGSPVEDVRLVVPAGWGPRRRTWMRHAAHRAGLPQPRLVEAPVAVAAHLLATGVQLPVGSFIVVCDVGGGAEASVLRRGPAGFEVLATLADPAAGGTAIDHALTALLAGDEAGPTVDAGAWWALTASVHAAKHALTDHAAVTVPLPAGPAAVVNGAVLEQAAQPVLQRTAQLTTEAIAAAEMSPADIAGVYCVGGAAQMPLTEKILTEHAGLTPVLVADPALAAARGAADAGAAGPATDVPVDAPPPLPPVRRAAAIAVPGFASLGLVSQFLLSPEWHGGLLRPWAVLNWGELAMAAVFAVIASLGAGTVIASAIASRSTTEPTSPGGQVGTGILASASLGVAVAGMYAVVGSLYIGADVGPFLRWALLPVAPIVVVAAVMALVAARQWRTPRGGWSELLAFPTGSVVTGAVGMALIQYSLTADRWPERVLWIDIAGRVGGLLLGVGVVMAVVSPLVLRMILAAPLAVITAAIVSRPASGILGVIYAIAVALWWIRQVWTRIVRPGRPPVRAT